VWKRVGERALEASGLDWTVIRPGGLTEREHDLSEEGIVYSSADQQERDSIPRRLVARCCVEAMRSTASIGRVIEVTSSVNQPQVSLDEAIASW